MASLSMSEKGAAQLHKAAANLTIFSESEEEKSTAAQPTKDRLPSEDWDPSRPAAPGDAGDVSKIKAGSFEKLNAMFGGVGGRFQLPNS